MSAGGPVRFVLMVGLLTAPALGLAASAQGAAVVVLRVGQVIERVPLRYRDSHSVELIAARTVIASPAKAQAPALQVSGVPSDLAGPLAGGSVVGRVAVRVDGATVGSSPLITARAVPAVALGQRLRDFLSRPVTIFALAALVGCSLILAMLRRRATRRGTHDERGSGYGRAG